MGVQLTLAALCLLFVIAKTSMVDVTREWKPNFGWEVVCTWKLYANDSLQSVRLHKSDQQFMMYRPESDGPKSSFFMRLPTMDLQAHCSEADKDGVSGKCVITLEVLQPVTEDTSYTCEVCGERPTFRLEAKTVDVQALVPPTDAVVTEIVENGQTSGRVSVNCTSSGLPAPNLVWTIGDQQIPADFSGGSWNSTSKLYHVWSSLSYTPDGISYAVCSPEVVRAGQLLKGTPVQHSTAEVVRGGLCNVLPLQNKKCHPHDVVEFSHGPLLPLFGGSSGPCMVICHHDLGTVIAKTSMVDVTREWKPNFGWEVVCTWKLYANDSLQSVRLHKSDQQFMIYRPERDGPKRSSLMRLPTMELQAHCSEADRDGVSGKCVITLEVLQPVTEDTSYTCEVSGERPTFRLEAKTVDVQALVPPTDAVVTEIVENDQTSGRVSVNCTSSGLPAPNLVWTIGDQKIPADFSGSSWNFTSKLYHVWSSLSYTPDGISYAVCSPEVVRAGQLLKGTPVQHSTAEVVRGAAIVNTCLLLLLTWAR